MKKLDLGTEVTYTNDKGKTKKGVIHAIRKAEDRGKIVVIGYLVDTGKDNPDFDGAEDRQPEQVDVLPENIRAVE